MAINELRAISVFVTAAELGSLRKTAAALNISPQAASQALAQLEQHLDVRLFHRTTRSMALTDEGQRFLDEAQPSLLGLRRAEMNGCRFCHLRTRVAKDGDNLSPYAFEDHLPRVAPRIWPSPGNHGGHGSPPGHHRLW